MTRMIRTVSAATAAAIDGYLMGPQGGYGLEQLMELAGLAVAECSYQLVGEMEEEKEKKKALSKHEQQILSEREKAKIIVVVGPGNNGGDGLVAARHLHHFGCAVSVCLPRPVSESDKAKGHVTARLVAQLVALGIDFLPLTGLEPALTSSTPTLIVDALFGFSFKGAVREPFDQAIKAINNASSLHSRILSVDIPSGWDVDKGYDISSPQGIKNPYALLSLTAPKYCARFFQGRHFIGGRFVTPFVQQNFGVDIPNYHGSHQCVEIPYDSLA
ncbi:hypothetical protein HK100_003429 [Physocladia obscura]|uniref:NAD(P)H-hydrate epimerase n=1 Tax=Physocladia obscura TaxID=109957 RepID=A0AAD5T016_9FUNG|nr:hypothetical protein HK100_003429 [Physocladia obscura]